MVRAEELLRLLLLWAEQPDLRAAAATHLEEIHRTIEHNRLVDLYNGAVRQAKAGNTAAAIASLEEILRSDPRKDLRRTTQRLLDDLR